MGLSIPTCGGIKKNGQSCSYKGRYNGFCKLHGAKADLEDCPICYESMKTCDTVKTCCNHGFHRSCLQLWTNENPSCPICRHALPSTARSRHALPSTARSRRRAAAAAVASRAPRTPAWLRLPPPAPSPSFGIPHPSPPVIDLSGPYSPSTPVFAQAQVYINSDADLDHFLASIRNAPVDVRFTRDYWG